MRINYNVKAKMVELAGACFWYWSSFHGFLDSSGISKSLYGKYPKGSFSKYDVMRNVLDVLEDGNDTEGINAVVSNFYRLDNAVDRDQLDNERAKQLLREFRETVGNDPIEAEIRRKERERARESYRDSVENRRAKDRRLSDLNRRFLELTTANGCTAQQRGFELERLFFDLLQFVSSSTQHRTVRSMASRSTVTSDMRNLTIWSRSSGRQGRRSRRTWLFLTGKFAARPRVLGDFSWRQTDSTTMPSTSSLAMHPV